MIFWKKNKPSNSLLYRQPEIRWRIPPVNKSFTLRPVSILALGGGEGGGEVVAGFGGSQDFQGEWRGNLLSPIKYKEGTIESDCQLEVSSE